MLSAPASAGILRAACVRSHPPQTNTLDLRVAVDLALGRLTMTRNGGDAAPSNAFVATLKRAQAQPYRRPGRTGGKAELEKLVVSVLDDPSVYRVVLRAAGFSSSQVDASSEQSSGVGWDVAASSPNPFHGMIRAGRVQTSLLDGSNTSVNRSICTECQASKAMSGAGRPDIFGGTVLGETTASIIPPWLRRYKDTNCCGACPQAACRRLKFTELSATNHRILCDALELRVPRHGSIVAGTSSTVLRCRSGVTRRRLSSSLSTWLLFIGRDGGGKMAVARELARLVFDSYAEFTTLHVQGDPDIPARSGMLTHKRPRSPDNGNGGDLGARLFEAFTENPHRLILIDDVDRLDRDSEMRIRNAVADGGMVRGCNGDVVGLEDAIVVLSASDVLDSRYVASSSSPRVKRRFSGQNREEGDATEMEVRCRRRHGWDLNVCAVDEEEEEEEDSLADDGGIMNVVDGVFLFN
ncbi:hypothetical protein VPH35_087210 [Triticum aestivum]